MNKNHFRNAYTFSSLEEVVQYLLKIAQHFNHTRLKPVIEIMRTPGEFNYDVELRIEEARELDMISYLELKIQCEETWGLWVQNGVKVERLIYDFRWTTALGHAVWIKGDLTDMESFEGEFIMRIGKEKSEYFYPTILKLLEDED